MSDIDPLKVMRNPETLHAYRQYQRALWKVAQPWMAIGLVAFGLEMGLLLFTLHRGSFRQGYLAFGLLMLTYGLCFLVAAVRVRLYRRSHPLILPEPPALWVRGGDHG